MPAPETPVIARSSAPGTGPSVEPAPPLAAHGTLVDHYATDADREAYVQRMFDTSAADYERIEGLLSFGTGPSYRRYALRRAGLVPGMRVLDVGIGTGLVARAARAILGPDGVIVGVDPSPGMLAQVRVPGVQVLCGRAEALPRPDASADFVSVGYALRHIGDVAAALREFRRVLRPGGRLCVLEISRPASPVGLALLRGYLRAAVPAIARIAGRRAGAAELLGYWWDTIEACIAPAQIQAAMQAAGFEQVRRHVELGLFSEFTATRPA